MTKEAFLKKVGKRLTYLREKSGLSQSELALRCDKDRQSIHRLEKGHTNPTAFFLLQLANELNVSVKELLDIE